MIHRALVLAALLLTGCASSQKIAGAYVDGETAEMCEQAGGCALVTRAALEELLMHGIQLGRASCKPGRDL